MFLIPFLSIAANRVVATLCRGLFKPEAPAFLEILLMILLRPVELLCWENFSYYLPVQEFLLPLKGLPRSFLLLRRVVIYSRSVLSPHIISLHAQN